MKPKVIVYTGCATALLVAIISFVVLLRAQPSFVMEDDKPTELDAVRVLAYSVLFGVVGLATVFVYFEVIDPEI